MQLEEITTKQPEPPQYRIIRGGDGVVRRVDVKKAQEAMRYAMVIREHIRSSDVERIKLLSAHVN